MALSASLRKLVSNANNKYSRSSGARLKPKEGVNRYRILVPSKKDAPWLPDNGQFWCDVGVHWIKADENGKPLAVVGCPSICYQQPSELATAIDAAINSAIDEESKKLYESWKARSFIIVGALDRSKGSTNPDEPQILELTPTTWGKVMGVIQQYDDEGEDILDPNEGLDITITRTGKGLNTEYSVNIAAGKSAPVPAAALKNVPDLPAHVAKEFFRGDEPKALAAINQIAGVNVQALPSSRTPTRALSSRAAQVEDAEVVEDEAVSDEEVAALEEEEVVVAETKAAAPARKPVQAPKAETPVEDDMDELLADLDGI